MHTCLLSISEHTEVSVAACDQQQLLLTVAALHQHSGGVQCSAMKSRQADISRLG